MLLCINIYKHTYVYMDGWASCLCSWTLLVKDTLILAFPHFGVLCFARVRDLFFSCLHQGIRLQQVPENRVTQEKTQESRAKKHHSHCWLHRCFLLQVGAQSHPSLLVAPPLRRGQFGLNLVGLVKNSSSASASKGTPILPAPTWCPQLILGELSGYS